MTLCDKVKACSRSAYIRGCRGEACTDAAKEYQAKWRAENRDQEVGYRARRALEMRQQGVPCTHCEAWVTHGLDTTYVNHKCRCEPCTEAHAVAWQIYKAEVGQVAPRTVGLRMADWTDEASCRDMDTDQFFDSDEYKNLRPICWACPVRLACLDDAMHYETSGPRDGMRGGMDPWERRIEARRRAGKREWSQAEVSMDA